MCVYLDRQIFDQIIKQSKNTYLEHWDQETKTLSKLQLQIKLWIGRLSPECQRHKAETDPEPVSVSTD